MVETIDTWDMKTEVLAPVEQGEFSFADLKKIFCFASVQCRKEVLYKVFS